MGQKIKLTESQLNDVIKKIAKSVLKEDNTQQMRALWLTFINAAKQLANSGENIDDMTTMLNAEVFNPTKNQRTFNPLGNQNNNV